jgi:hypothetical protein
MTTTSTSIVVYDPELAGPEHIALAGFPPEVPVSPTEPVRGHDPRKNVRSTRR